MPRPLVFSNGSFFIGMDGRGTIRDLFYPQIGRYNHLNGHPIRVGVWTEDGFSWTHDVGWTCTQSYTSLAGSSICANEELKVRIGGPCAVSHSDNWFVWKVSVSNVRQSSREVRVFFSHDFRMLESDIGDTAFFHPKLGGVVHYKGSCYLLCGGDSVDQYATGLKGWGGFEGTWRDAEDGELSMNPIAQGSVDSTIRFSLALGPGESKEFNYCILAAEDLDSLEETYARFHEKTVPSILGGTIAHWTGWGEPLRQRLQTANLPERICKLAEQSLLIARAQIDNGGAVIAATDSDIMETNRANYCYMWPRDGALVSAVLDSAGQHRLPRAFFEFCGRILPKHPSILHQKYTADGKLGATWHPWIRDGKPVTPFQEDETAALIQAIWNHHCCFSDEAALRHHFEQFVQPACSFLLEYINPETGLPLPSYDLWEERYGVHTYTVATVIMGLEAASAVATTLGSEKLARKYSSAAAQMKESLGRLASPQTGVFCRRLYDDNGEERFDWTADASLLLIGILGVLPIDDPRVLATAAKVEQSLWVHGLGGVARYEGDYYFRRHDDPPGNPWIICTLWLAQHKLLSGDRARALELVVWCADRAAPTGVLPEQVDAVTGEHLSVSPLTWSHAEFVKTCFMLSGD